MRNQDFNRWIQEVHMQEIEVNDNLNLGVFTDLVSNYNYVGVKL